MQVVPASGTAKGSDTMFTGDVYVDVIASGQAPSRIRVNSVHFTPGSRTAWHCHAVGQILHVTYGIGVVQSSGSDILAMRSGDTIVTPPGEWHWHGAARNHFMTHLAIWEAPESGDESSWGELVRDEEYDQQPNA
ncbi:MAG: transcriptional regulator [Acidimicrobiaceae bacterium]|nr:transcriptional regulator [Acidimicrobiaceae bacterium]